MNPDEAIEYLEERIPEKYRINTYLNLVNEIKEGRPYPLKGLEFKIKYIKNQAEDIKFRAIQRVKKIIPDDLKNEFEYKDVIKKLNQNPILCERTINDNNVHINRFINSLNERRIEEEVKFDAKYEIEKIEKRKKKKNDAFFIYRQQHRNLQEYKGVGITVKTGCEFYRDEAKSLKDGAETVKRTDDQNTLDIIQPTDLI